MLILYHILVKYGSKIPHSAAGDQVIAIQRTYLVSKIFRPKYSDLDFISSFENYGTSRPSPVFSLPQSHL